MGLAVDGVSVSYRTASKETRALDGISMSLGDSEFVSLIGPSGCGKTTLLKVIAGVVEPSSGSVQLSFAHEEHRLPSALAFQDRCVFPWMTVLENVAFGLEFRKLSGRQREEIAEDFIDQVGLREFSGSYPHELSVGMRQRVGIARAFVANPQVLLLDEPFAALDALTKLVLQEELLKLWHRHGTLVVYVTHDLEEAVLLADRVLVMSGRPGRIREEIEVPLGRPRDLVDRSPPEVSAIEKRLWAALEDEVRQGLAAPQEA